jgi:hypothetical protein
MSALGGCQMHNLHCGYPKCLTDDVMQPAVKEPAKNYVLINGMHFSHSEILEWREKEVAYRDRHADDVAVDTFAQAMKNKMAQMRERGRGGWDKPDECTVESLIQMLIENISKGDPVDIGNFAMMLFHRDVLAVDMAKALMDSYLTYHKHMEAAKRKAKDAMGIVELPRILVELYIDMQNNASRYTVDRRVTTEERLVKLLAYPEDHKKVSNEF